MPWSASATKLMLTHMMGAFKNILFVDEQSHPLKLAFQDGGRLNVSSLIS
jgi:hypothetical protein